MAKNIFYEDAKLIFSLAADEEHDDILMLMDKIKINGKGIGNAERTFFSEYIPDPFAFCNVNLYETLLPINSIENVEEIPKKKSFFRKKKEKKNGK